MADFKNIEDLLGEGEHVIKVYPQREWNKEEKKWIEGTHKKGVSKKGFKWWMYSTKVGDDYVTVFANEKNKAAFDSGQVKCSVRKKFDPDTGQPVLKTYFDPVERQGETSEKQGFSKEDNYSKYDDDIAGHAKREEDLPF